MFPSGQTFAHGLTAIGYCDLGGTSAFKMAMHRDGDRWLLYTGTFWDSGFNIVDVTDPTDPRLLRHVPVDVPEGFLTLQVQVAAGVMITSVETLNSVMGDGTGPQAQPSPDEGFLIWTLEDPENPTLRGHFRTGGDGTHRNYYAGGPYVYATGLPYGYQGHILQVVDITDPTEPVEAARWWQKGQWLAGGESGAAPGTLLHGGSYVTGDRAYLPYGAGGLVILDLTDVRNPRQVSDLTFSPPFNPYITVHTAVPLEGRPLVLVNSEAIAENGDEPLNFAGIVDVSTETAPRLISLCPLPAAPDGAPYRTFYDKGGRFGPHNQHQWQGNDALLHDENLLFLTYFNAGLRVYDISDARAPREVAWFVPPDPETRLGPLPRNALVSQTEDVVVDARQNIYITDKNLGIYVLRLDT